MPFRTVCVTLEIGIINWVMAPERYTYAAPITGTTTTLNPPSLQFRKLTLPP